MKSWLTIAVKQIITNKMIKIKDKIKAKLLTHFEGQRTKLLLATFYFFDMSVKNVKRVFLKSEKRKIRNLKHCLTSTAVLRKHRQLALTTF